MDDRIRRFNVWENFTTRPAQYIGMRSFFTSMVDAGKQLVFTYDKQMSEFRIEKCDADNVFVRWIRDL